MRLHYIPTVQFNYLDLHTTLSPHTCGSYSFKEDLLLHKNVKSQEQLGNVSVKINVLNVKC